MESGAQPEFSRRVAAGATLLLLLLLAVLALLLALMSLPSLLAAWVGLVIVVFGFSSELRSSGPTRWFWVIATVAGLGLTIGALLWLGWSSPWALLGVVIVAGAIALVGQYALRQRAPTAGRLSAERPVLFVNPKSGGGKATDAGIAAIAARRGIDVRILELGDDLTEMAVDAIAGGADAIGMAGGDGSLGYVATATIDAGIPFICIPAGTRNHFARDLGLDRTDIVGALGAFTGELRMIDYATVNNRVFLNVASLGVYAETVSDPAYRDAKIETARETLRSLDTSGVPFDLRFSDQTKRHHETAGLVMVSSGRYETKGVLTDIGKRARLDSGYLGILTLTASDASGVVEAATLWVSGAIDRYAGWDQWEESSFDVDSDSSLPMGIDGETVSMEPPLHFTIHPGAFAVAVPEGTPHGPRVSPLGTVGSARRLWAIAMGRNPK